MNRAMNLTYSLVQTDYVVTVASWEERFLLGMSDLLRKVNPKIIMMFFYRDKEFAQWSAQNRENLKSDCKRLGIEVIERELTFASPSDSWRIIGSSLADIPMNSGVVTLDISTMPRETIWSICHVLRSKQVSLQYTYHRPENYGDWLTRDPGRPRIVYKQGGIQHLGRLTALVIQTGYDIERSKQLVRFFEPAKLYFGLQTGTQYGNIEHNKNEHALAFTRHRDMTSFDTDGYSLAETVDSLKKHVAPLTEEYNVVVASLGPKVSALGLYAFKVMYSSVALCYAPSNEVNYNYSTGYRDRLAGHLAIDMAGVLDQGFNERPSKDE